MVKIIHYKLLTLLFLICATIPLGFSQTEEQVHNKAQDAKKAIVHSQGYAPKDKGFFELYGTPKLISSFADTIEWLFWWTSIVAGIFFAIVFFALLYFIIFNRAKPGQKAFYTKGKSKGEKITAKLLDLSIFLALDLVILGASFYGTGSPIKIDKFKDIGFLWNMPKIEESIQVQVMPQQWAWNFKYPGKDNKFGTKDDIFTINQLVIPKDKKVLIQMKSRDVIHGFWIPNARIQMDALAGQVSQFWFDSNTTGNFEIVCAHLCGTSHYKMKAFLRVIEQEDWTAWMNENSEWALETYDEETASTYWGWDWGVKN